jgi:hypothetical protein
MARRGPRRKGGRTNRVEVLARRLPEELRSFDAWYYHNNGDAAGLRDYLLAMKVHLQTDSGVVVADVMEAAGFSAADWYRYVLQHEDETNRAQRQAAAFGRPRTEPERRDPAQVIDPGKSFWSRER